MRVFVAMCLFCVSSFALAEFTDSEKVEAYKWVRFEEFLSDATKQVAFQVKQEGHINRDIKYRVLKLINSAKKNSHMFFNYLSATTQIPQCDTNELRPRAAELENAQKQWAATLSSISRAVGISANDPSLSRANTTLQKAFDVLDSFDWALEYLNPLHDDIPTTPWDESKTVVGPHGNLACSKATLLRFGRYLFFTVAAVDALYGTSEVWSETANADIARVMDKLASARLRAMIAYAMHADVMSDEERAIIAQDDELSATRRGAGFHRALRQLEYTLNVRKFGFAPKHFTGRELATGVTGTLNIANAFNTTVRKLIPLNTPEEMFRWHNRGGPIQRFMVNFPDAWQDLDNWGMFAFGFFDPSAPAPGPEIP